MRKKPKPKLRPLTGQRLLAHVARREAMAVGPRRIRRPFIGAPRKPTRRELLGLFQRIYGPKVSEFEGAPYQGTRFNHAELILHELAHATQVPGEIPVRRGGMGPSFERMQEYLWRNSMRALADRHEMKAVAIAIGVVRRLRLPLARERLVSSGARNCRSWDLAKDHRRFARDVERAENTPAVWFGVQYILDLLDAEWSAQCQASSLQTASRARPRGQTSARQSAGAATS